MTPKQLEQWGRVRRKGRTRYIWVYGVLGWGVTTGVAWSLAMTAMEGDWDRLPILMPGAVVAFMIGGYFFGRWTWRIAENQYERAKRDAGASEV